MPGRPLKNKGNFPQKRPESEPFCPLEGYFGPNRPVLGSIFTTGTGCAESTLDSTDPDVRMSLVIAPSTIARPAGRRACRQARANSCRGLRTDDTRRRRLDAQAEGPRRARCRRRLRTAARSSRSALLSPGAWLSDPAWRASSWLAAGVAAPGALRTQPR